jgi:hypothetical protein
MEKQENPNLQKLLEQVRSEIAGKLLEENQKPLEIQLKNYDTRDKNRFNKTVGGYLDKILQNYDSLETYYALKFKEWLSAMEIARKYFDFSDKKQLRHQPDECKYYCFHCDKKLTRKQSRRHRLKNHLVVKLTEPKPKVFGESKFDKSIKTRSFLEPFIINKCYYCGKFEKDDFPLTRKVIGYQEIVNDGNLVEKPVEVHICPICYYQRFGKRPLSGNSKNPMIKQKIAKVLWIQRNYVVSLKSVDPEMLQQITNRIRLYIKQQIEEKLEKFKMKLEESRDPEYDKKLSKYQEQLEKELRDKLSRAVILC